MLAAGAIVLAAFAARDAAILSWLAVDPASEAAAQLGSPALTLSRLEATFGPDGLPGPDEAAEVAEAARAALRAAPLQPSALRDLAFAGERMSRPGTAGILRLSERLSRRDAGVQGALLRQAALSGDYKNALVHIDRILTVAPERLADLVEPLAAVLSTREGQQALAPYGRQPWFAAFAQNAAGLRGDPRNLATTLMLSSMPRGEQRTQVSRMMLARLIAAGDVAGTRDFAVRFGNAPASAFDAFAPGPATVGRSWEPLSWQLADVAEGTARIDGPNGLRGQVAPGASLNLASRITMLSARAYLLDQQVSGDSTLRLTWQLVCARPDGKTVWMQRVPLSERAVHFRSRVVIPTDCPIQQWSLSAANDQDTQVDFALADLSLRGE